MNKRVKQHVIIKIPLSGEFYCGLAINHLHKSHCIRTQNAHTPVYDISKTSKDFLVIEYVLNVTVDRNIPLANLTFRNHVSYILG
jgi:hypothetical protein